MEQKSTSLATLVKDHNALVELIIESGGELNETLENWLKIDETNIAQKVDGYKYAMDELEDRAEILKKRAEVFRNAAKTLENVVVRMKENLKFQMQNMGSDEILGTDFRFKLSKPTEKLVIESEDMLPASYMNEEIIFKPNKEKILSDLKRGAEVAGCSIGKTQSLRSYVNTSAKTNKIEVA